MISILACSRTRNIPVQVHAQDEPTSQQYHAVSSPKQPNPPLVGFYISITGGSCLPTANNTPESVFFWWVGRGMSSHSPVHKTIRPIPVWSRAQIEESGYHLKDGSSPAPSFLYRFVARFSPSSLPQRHPSPSRPGMPAPQIRLLPHGHGAGEHRLVDHRPC